MRPAKKVKVYHRFSTTSPYPDFKRPSQQECQKTHRILTAAYGERDLTATNAMNADGIDRPSVFPDPLDRLL